MARMQFGGGPEDVYLVEQDDGDLQAGQGATVLFYTAETGGSPITDLQDVNGNPVTLMRTSTGTDSRAHGQIPPFYGPDSIYEMWASANGSPRFLMQASNLGSYLGPVKDDVTAHTAAVNPHGTRLRDLVDVSAGSVAAATDGQALVYQASSGLWIAGTAVTGGGGGGGTGDVTTTTDQTLTGSKTFAPAAAKSGIKVQATATGQSANLFEASSGTDTGQAGARQVTTSLDPAGQLRLLAAKTTAVPVRIKAQASQSANLLEVADSTDAVKAWIAANYGIYAPNMGRTFTFAVSGAITVGTGTMRVYADVGVPLTIRSVRASVGTAGTSSSVFDIRVGGTSIYSVTANRPTVTSGQVTSGRNTGFSTTQIPDGSYLTCDVITAGTGAANAVIQIDVY